MSSYVKNIPDEFLEKWQSITNLLASVIKIPAALIMKTDMQNMEVFITSKSENNPYKAGEKEQWHGLYCETVIKTQQELLISNALNDPVWDNNPDLKLGMIAYLGLPLNYPDQTPFGTLCVLDVKENSFSEDHKALLYQFKQVIELDLALIHALDWSDPEGGRGIIQKLIKQNDECKAINRDLVDVNNRLLKEQVKAEKSESHFRSLVENAPYTIFLQIEGKIFYINKKGLELFGADTPEELIGIPIISHVHPDYRDAVRQRIANLNNRQIPQTGFEQILFKLDGTHVHVETSGIPYNYDGSNGALVFVRDITKRKEAERELIHRHQLSEFIIRHDPYGVAVFDSNLHFLFVSEKFLEDYQLRDQEVIGRHHYDVMPDIPQKWKEVHQRVLKGEILSVDEDTYLKPDGSVEIVRWECRPWYHIDDTIGGIVVYTELITQRKRLEASTRKAYELIKNLAAQVPGVIYQYRLYPDGRSAFPFSSEGMYEIYEVTPEMVKDDASVVFTRLHPDDVDYIVESIYESARNQSVYHSKFRVILPEQGLRWRQCNAQPELLEDGSTLWHGIIMDITDEKSKEDLLKERNEEINTFFECSLDLLCIADKTGHFIRLNSEWENVLGYPVSELEGRNFLDFVHPDDQQSTEEAMSKLNELQSIKPFTNRYVCKDGSIRWIEWKATPVGNRVYATARDITSRIRINNELLQAKEKAEESNRLKTEFLNNLSHEIRTPMNGIMGFSEMLTSPDLTRDKRNYYVKIIRNSSAQLLKTIDDILEISTLETKQIKIHEEAFDINDLLMELFSVFSQTMHKRNVPLYLNKTASAPQSIIISDKLKISKILSNLLDNALKFTQEGFIELGYVIGNDKLILSVKDTGIGIGAESQKVIFERFSQELKDYSEVYGGLGLGLAISKENAAILGGEIAVESAKGAGSTFYVTIPYKPAVSVPKMKESSEVQGKPSESRTITILIAEDEEVNYLFLEALFTGRKENTYNLIHARNGKEAVDHCQANESIDLVLMDIKMPVMNGHEATKAIKATHPDLPVIAQTAYSTSADRELAFQYGCDDFITKPVQRKTLFSIIEKFLKSE